MAHDAAIAELRALLGDRLSTTDAERTLHGQNETYYPNTPPDAVAWPDTTEEVSQIVQICARHGTPITPYGAASSLEGQHLALHGGISLDMSRMNRVLAVVPEDLLCTVQPGITRLRLNEDLRSTGLRLVILGCFLPAFHGAIATACGVWIGMAPGGAAIFGAMVGSASYIAAPAAVRIALPEASPGIYLTLSLGVTFPFNLSVGIPIFIKLAETLSHAPTP